MANHTGTIKKWNPERCFEFVEDAEGGPDVFLHLTGFTRFIDSAEKSRISVGTKIIFDVAQRERSEFKVDRAVNVEIVE